jgi:hypothetical protein
VHRSADLQSCRRRPQWHAAFALHHRWQTRRFLLPVAAADATCWTVLRLRTVQERHVKIGAAAAAAAAGVAGAIGALLIGCRAAPAASTTRPVLR